MDVVLWSDCPHPTSGFLLRSLGPYKIANYVRRHGYTAQVIDFATLWPGNDLWDLTSRFLSEKTMVLGVSTTFIAQHTWNDSGERFPKKVLDTLRRIKQEYPHIKVVFGGHLSDKVPGWDLCDAAVTGYAEDTFLELLNHWRHGTTPPQSKRHITHFGGKLRTSYFAPNEKRHSIETDSFQFSEQDCITPGETLPIEVSRGCMFKCKFCQFELLGRGKLDYLRSFECVKQELLLNYERWGTTSYYVVCDTFNDTEFKVKAWCDMVASLPFKIHFCAYIRADLLHRFPDTPLMLKEAGMVSAFHGLETLNKKASHAIGKAWSGTHAREWIPHLYHDIWKGEVGQHINLIVGLPHDSPESVEDAYNWFVSNKLHSLRFDPLLLYKNPWMSVSEFERDYAKYGFSFDANDKWVSEWWTEDQARAMAKELNERAYPHTGHNIWYIANLLGLGWKKDDPQLMGTRDKFDWALLKERRREVAKAYYKKLNTLEVQ